MGFAKTKLINFVLLVFVATAFDFSLHSCGRSSKDETAELIPIKISIAEDYSQEFSIRKQGESLDLVTTATSLVVRLSGCTSGYRYSATVSSGATFNAYLGDTNCVLRVTGFTIGSQAYTNVGTGAVNFASWFTNDVATFQGASSTDLIQVYVISQLTQTGVTNTDTVSYKFTDIASTTTSNLSQANIIYSGSILVTGDTAPNFTMTDANVVNANSSGALNLTFTLQCGTALTGTSLTTYACSGMSLDSTPVQLDYIFIPDAYSQSALTVAQLTSAFAAHTATSVGTNIIVPGGTDSYQNTLANGGFYTPNMITGTGTTSVTTSGLNNVFMIRAFNAARTNVLSYKYFYVNIPTTSSNTTVSGCGTTFAGGSGTYTDPYIVIDATTLANTANCNTSSTYFLQAQNINLSGYSWTPITMYGQYNGGGYNISNLSYTNTSTTANDGLFSTINSGASVSNVNVLSANVTSLSSVGILTSSNSGSVTNCTSSGTVTSSVSTSSGIFVGGLIGINLGSIVSSSSSASVVGNLLTGGTGTVAIGGLEGSNNSSSTSTTSNSFATGNVSISSVTTAALQIWIGNLSGAMNGTITNSYATGNVSVPAGATGATIYAGSVGYMNSGTLTGNFSKGTFTISSGSSVLLGGMIGFLGNASTISKNYSMAGLSATGPTGGNVGGYVGLSTPTTPGISFSYVETPSFSSGLTNKHGFMGNTGNTVTSSYYYTNSGAIPSDTTTGVTGLATQAAMQLQSNYSGFTFSTTSPAPVQNWVMPTANTFSSPSAFLSPVLAWQCGSNGITCSVVTCGAADFAGGSGTISSPYQIATATHLQNIQNCSSSSNYFLQTANINLTSVTWTPYIMYGHYDGGGFSISNLTYSNTSSTSASDGLFSSIYLGASVANTNLTSANVTSYGTYGGILAGSNQGSISNSSVGGTLSTSATATTHYFGGLVGINGLGNGGTISNSSSSAAVSLSSEDGNSFYLGALVGSNNDSTSTISYSSATGSVTAPGYAGSGTTNIYLGALAAASNGSITNSYASASISGTGLSQNTAWAAGFVGTLSSSGSVSGCFAKGTYQIVGGGASTGGTPSYLGGMVGNMSGGTVTNSYTMTSIAGDTGASAGTWRVGGFIGGGSATTGVSKSYSADPSVASSASGSTLFGFFGQSGKTATNAYLYQNGSIPADSSTGVTTLSSQTAIQTQSNFTGFTFGVSSDQNWDMPTANTFASPSGLLSPVLRYQCGSNGISC